MSVSFFANEDRKPQYLRISSISVSELEADLVEVQDASLEVSPELGDIDVCRQIHSPCLLHF